VTAALAPCRYDAAEVEALAAQRLHRAPPGEGEGAPRGDDDLNPSARAIPYGEPFKPAAVLVPIVARPGGATVILTQRTAHLPSHPGQIAFPGGKIDPGDGSALAAALRETEEETGLDRRFVTPVGYLDTYVTRTAYRVTPVVAVVRPGFALAAEPGEVEDIFEAPLAFLMDPANHQRHSRVWQGAERFFYAMPWGERYIWGATAGMIRNLYDRLYG
jgi:8-oxo-dGTP pyrophosphatase MutT (NUDIX family)